jgi:NAD(P)-dependent dehydrogenase (short-subunit alcohol dehydrogenase family)
VTRQTAARRRAGTAASDTARAPGGAGGPAAPASAAAAPSARASSGRRTPHSGAARASAGSAGRAPRIVVLTGASSGLGRAAAIEFARRGAHVVLAARRGDALEETARLCREAGGDATVVVTDVTREDDVRALVDAALALRGRIDVWVNNAGVTLFAPLEGAPFEEHRRVIEVNLFGAMYAARAVVPVFRRQRRGVMINVGSILSKIGQPFVPSYVISKFALRGLTEALRTELADLRDVHVCSLLPYAIDTPHFESGGNRVGREAFSMPPVQEPQKVARVMADLAERPVRERHVPRIALLGLALHAILPRTTERLILDVLREWHFGDRPEPRVHGNLFAPDDDVSTAHGTRPPQLGLPALAAWIVGHVGRMLLPVPSR